MTGNRAFFLALFFVAGCGMQRGEDGSANLNNGGAGGNGVAANGTFDSSAPMGGTADFNPGQGLDSAQKAVDDLKNNKDLDLTSEQTSALGDTSDVLGMLDKAYTALDDLPEGYGNAGYVAQLFSRARQEAYETYLKLRDWDMFDGLSEMLYRYYLTADVYRSYNKSTRSHYWTKDLGDWLAARGRGFQPEGVAFRVFRNEFADCKEKIFSGTRQRTLPTVPGIAPGQVASFFVTDDAQPANGGTVVGELGFICNDKSPNALLPLYAFKMANGVELETLLDAGDLFRVLRKRGTLQEVLGYTPY